MNQEYIYNVDFATSMLLTMNMNAMMTSHGIPMIVAHLNFMILINGWPPHAMILPQCNQLN